MRGGSNAARVTHALRSLVGFGKKKQVIRVPSITLAALLNGLPPVDLIHMDVQGVEYEVLKDAGPLLAAGVRRMAIATHTPEAEAGLRRLFRDLGWRNVFDFPRGGRAGNTLGKRFVRLCERRRPRSRRVADVGQPGPGLRRILGRDAGKLGIVGHSNHFRKLHAELEEPSAPSGSNALPRRERI